MRRLAALAVLVVAACAPLKSGVPNGSGFEMAVAGEANSLRAEYGRSQLGWSNGLHDDAARTAFFCAAGVLQAQGGEACHGITAQPEDIIWWPDSCVEDAGRAHDAVWLYWRASPYHLAFLVDYGWPPKQAQGVASACVDGVQVVVWAGA